MAGKTTGIVCVGKHQGTRSNAWKGGDDNLAKVGVVSSNLIARSNFYINNSWLLGGVR